MKIKLLNLVLSSTLMFMFGCGSIQKFTINTTATMLKEASKEIETDGNWEHFRMSTPGSLKFVEGMYYVEPKNLNLILTLEKGYGGYAFVVNETMYLEDRLAENNKEQNREQAIINYSKAIFYGTKYLELNGIKYDDLMVRSKEDGAVVGYLNKYLNGKTIEDLEAVMFLGQSIAGLTNMQKNRQELLAQLPLVKALFDWSCGHKPDLNFGACDIFYGSYEASRPKMLGGNPQKGKEHFLDGINKYPHNWLIRAAFIQNYAIPTLDEDVYKKEKFILDNYAKLSAKDLEWSPLSKNINEAFVQKRLRLYQALAMKRFEIIKKYEKNLF